MMINCWEDGPPVHDDDVGGTVNSTCMLPDGHHGPHVFTPDTKIVVQFHEDEA